MAAVTQFWSEWSNFFGRDLRYYRPKTYQKIKVVWDTFVIWNTLISIRWSVSDDQHYYDQYQMITSASIINLRLSCKIYFQLVVRSGDSGLAQLQFIDVHKFSFTPGFPYVNLLRKWWDLWPSFASPSSKYFKDTNAKSQMQLKHKLKCIQNNNKNINSLAQMKK